jgi:hypothetical protein
MTSVARGGACWALGLALIVTVTGCARPAPPSRPSPPPAPLDYQSVLTETDRSIGQAFAEVRAASTPHALAQRVLDAAGAASAAGERLDNDDPGPPAVSRDNVELASGLRRLGRELAYLSQRIGQHAICTGPVALRAISTAPSMAELREVAADLANAHGDRPTYHWGEALPPAQDETHRGMPNGTVLLDRRGARGDGVLEARNDGPLDAVVLLARDGAAVLSVAVSAGASTTVNGVPDGGYQVFYTAGSDWDRQLNRFGRQCEFHQVSGPTTFTTRPAAQGHTAYTVQTITIHGAGAAAPDTVEVPAEALPR